MKLINLTIELLCNNKLLNVMKNKYLYSVCEKLLVEHHGGRCYRILRSMNFGK